MGGPASTLSTKGSRYFLSIVDDYSKFIWYFPMQLKSNVSTLVTAFIQFVHNQFPYNIVSVQTDGFAPFNPFFAILEFIIALHVHTLINKMRVWNVVTITLWKRALPYSLMPQFLTLIGLRLFSLPLT